MEVTPETPAPEVRWATAAWTLALAMVGLLALIVIRLAVERGHRTELEEIVQSTAVGDAAWYQPPRPEPAAPIAAGTLYGQALVPASYRRIELRDSRMSLAGVEDAGRLRVYNLHDPAAPRTAEAERHAEELYLKTGPDEYLKLQPAGRGGK